MIKAPVLVVLHQERSTPGRVGQRLRERGFALDIRKPRFGDPLPRTLANHSGAVIFGGPMSANDPDDYVKREIDWINVALDEKAPFLGLCLGAQMLAKTLGGRVAPHADGLTEIGYYPIEATDAGRSLFGPWPKAVFQWHCEGILETPGATRLAGSAHFPVQAFRSGERAYGFQFHPEVTLAMHHRWLTLGAHRLGLPGAQTREQHLKGRMIHDRPLSRFLDGFLDHWIGDVASRTDDFSIAAE